MVGSSVGMSKYHLAGEEVTSKKTKSKQPDDWSFNVVDDPRHLPAPSFNVLLVESPRIGLFQTPEWRGLSESWKELVGMIKPVWRLGLPHTTLEAKCPYKSQASTPELQVIVRPHLRKVVDGVTSGDIFHHPHHHVPHGHPPLGHDVSPVLVLASNLLCYWLITKSSAKRGG